MLKNRNKFLNTTDNPIELVKKMITFEKSKKHPCVTGCSKCPFSDERGALCQLTGLSPRKRLIVLELALDELEGSDNL